MSTRAEKALKAQKDKHHSILRELVQEPPNKTCADCLAKGPRWASWNIGVFICIRCAGIHRNLGVHISKCKSIDLDSWTQEQLEHILKWGNKRAGLYYECYLPKDFTRPQGNQAVETFIRNKYEKKLYIKKDGEPELVENRHLDKLRGVATTEKENKPPSGRKKERLEAKSEEKGADKTILNIAKKAPEEVTGVIEEPAKLSVTPASNVKSSSMNDLLTLGSNSAPADTSVKGSASTHDLLNFGAFSDPVPTTPASSCQPPENVNANGIENIQAEPSKSTKESILSLYSSGNTNQQQKIYGVPGGVYMQQQMPQQVPQQGNMMYGYPQQSMPNQMHQMNSQMQQMNLNQANQMMTTNQSIRQGSINHYGLGGQPAFATPMYTSNSNMMSNQMNSVYQHQHFQPSVNVQNNPQPILAPNTAGNFSNNMGQNMQGMNTRWCTGQNMMSQMSQQQQQQQQQPAHFNMNAGHMMNGNSGYTMNNQLWK